MKTKINEKLVGGVLYALGLVLPLLRPPVDRAACTVSPSGEVCGGINPFFFTLELGLIVVGSLLVALGHPFKNSRERIGWLGVASGLGIAIIGGFSELNEVVIFGALLATLGLLLHKLGGSR